ncbi:MAG: T9SS type A sorting domain-containing protein [Algoriphagus sp.]|uniref:T9SS type A sorting domain-containing protein n=1 Tax=Algoriphagus sp. TaxID=1872435 RepID=UPI002734E2E2|nr:T9SS type A sorting domain-containing protein [Algoriphagus sp.]MDP3199901.1 T9SS type A sorting domain-containing protein [Algoriphagus sp.]
MLNLSPESAYNLKIKHLLLVGLLVLWYGVSVGQTTINAGQTVNASTITPGNSIIMNSGSVLNMDVNRSFGNLQVRNNNTNTSQISTIQGTGIATFFEIEVNATAPGGSQSSREISFEISSESTVNCTSLSAGTGNRNKSASIQGTLRLSGSGSPISTGWTTFSIGPNSTIEYNGADQTVFTGSTDNYHNLILSGSGPKGISGVKTIDGDFTMSGNNTTTATSNVFGGIEIVGDMIISAGNTLTLSSNTPSLTLSGNAIISGTVISPGESKSIGGDLTINTGGTWTENGASPAYTIAGSLTNNGTFSSGGGLYNLTGISKTLNGIISISNTAITGSYTNTGTLNVSSSLGGTGSLTQGENSTLNLGGTSTISNLDASTNCLNTVNFNGTAQTIKGVNYCNLSLSSSGTKTFQTGTTSIAGNFIITGTASTSAVAALTIGGNVEIGTGTTFTAGNFSHNVGGNWTRSGTFNAGTSTINFNGANPASIQASTFNNLTFSGAGAKTASGNLTITGNVLISNNFNAGSFTHTVSGDWTRTGTFTPGTSTINFNGTNPASIQASTFNNLTFSGAGAKTASGNLTITGNVLISNNFNAGSFTHTVGGDWTRTGTFTPGTSTVNFNGNNPASIQASTFNNLTFSGAGAKTASGNLTVNGNILISNNFNAGSGTHTLLGNWTNNGSFISGTSTIAFNGSTAQTISGSSTNSFISVSLNNSAGLTLSSAISINGTLTLSSGTMAAGTNLSMNSNAAIIRSSGAITGTIQGSNPYNLSYQGASKTTGGEVSGSGLNNISVALNASQTLTAGSSFSVSGSLTIPATINLNMGSFQLSGNTLSTSGTGTLSTQSTSATPIPLNRTWSFLVFYNNLSGGQKIVSGVYQNLSVQLNSGTTTLGPESEGPIEIASGVFEKTGSGTLAPGTSLVIFSSPSSQNLPAITYNKLELKGGGDKFFTGNQNILENLSINGTAVARLGSSNRTTNTLTLGGNGQPVGTFGSTGSAATFPNAQYFGTLDTGILNVTTSTLSCLNGTWIGGTSTDWFTASNWCGGIPTAATDVLIISSAPFQPLINTNGAVARNISIQTGASLTISGTFTLSVHGNWNNLGTFTSGTSSTVDFTGTPSAAIGAGSFANISFTGTGTKTINSTLTVAENITPVSTAVILSGSNTLTLNTGKTMEILSSGSFSTGTGKLILSPGALYVNRSTSTPTLEIQQTFTGAKGWRMIGSPVNTTYANLTNGLETQGFTGSTNPSLQPNLLWWDETDKGTTLQGWRQPSNLSAAAPAGRGHYFYIFNGATKPGGGSYTDGLPKTIALTGTEVNLASGDFNFGVTFTARDTNLVAQTVALIEVNQADEGFNLISNPTASVIDFYSSTGWNKANLDQSIYVWNPATSSFLTWNGTTGTLGSGRIAPFQAFWVKANAPSPVLQLSGNEAKTLASTAFYGRKQKEKNLTINLNVAGEGLEAESFISFENDGKIGADPKDAYQLESLAEDWLLLYTYGSLKSKSPLVINNQPALNGEEKVIPLHLAASKGGQAITGTYLMNWQLPAEWPAAVNVVLMDHINQKAIDMRKESMYSFTFQAPKIATTNARKSLDPLQIPQAVVFQSPYESGEVNARVSNSGKPLRPFTIYIGAFPNDRIEYLPDFPKLFAAVPNPFSEQTKIRFYLPVAEKVEISIYDLLGNGVGNFPSQDYGAGIQELDWIPNAIDLPNGLYIIRLSTSTGQFTQKLIKN